MNMKTYSLAFAIGLFSLSAARASLITSALQIGSPQTVINFAQFAGSNTMTTSGPVQVGAGVSFQSTNLDGSILGSGPYSLNDNGNWSSGLTFAGLNIDQFGSDQYTMTFSFAGHTVGAVGGFINYAVLQGSGFSDVILTALASNGSVLESYDITKLAPISTPNATDAGAFLGILRSEDDIAAFSLSNSAVAITDLTFASTTPEPQTYTLVFAGSVILALFYLTRARASATKGSLSAFCLISRKLR